MSLTVAILAQDETGMIAAAIGSASVADEVLVCDGGSTDGTQDIARDAGARVVERPFDDFARQRNFCLEQATGEWVFFCDADERITPALGEELRALSTGAPEHDAYAVPRRNMALGKWLGWHPGGPDMPVRLLRREGPRWSGAVHEVVEGASSIGALRNELLHLTHRSVSEVVAKIDRYSDFESAHHVEMKGGPAPSAREILDAYPRALKDLLRSGLQDEGMEGAIEAALLAFGRTLLLAKVWERSRPEPLAETYRRVDQELDQPARNGSA